MAKQDEFNLEGLEMDRDTFQKALKLKYPNLLEKFLELENDQAELFSKKMLDYGIDNIKAGTNLETSEEIMFALNGIWFRMMDKMNRWKNMQLNKSEPNCESLADTFMDLANYAMIANIVLNRDWHK